MASETESKVCRLDVGEPSAVIMQKVQDSEQLVQRYKDLFKQERFSDIILRVGDQRYHAHRFVLITASSVFEAMLGEQRWKEATQPEVFLSEEEECQEQFEHFLGYLYSGEAALQTTCVLPLLLLADKYEVSSLRRSCLRFMMDHIVQSPDTNRALTWYQYAQMTGQTDLEEKSLSFILSNFDTVMQAFDWPYMPLRELMEFLHSSEIVVHSEWTLWMHVETWLLHPNNKADLSDNLRAILPAMRFTMVPPKLLAQMEHSLLNKDHKEVFADKLNQAYRRHSLVMDEPESASGDAFLREGLEEYRNYKSDDYCLCHKFSLPCYATVNKIDTRITIDCKARHRFVSPSRAKTDDQTLFSVYFFPRGYFTTLTIYGSYMGRQSNNVTLKLIRRRPDLEPMSVSVTLALMGKKNDVKYTAFARHWTVVFTKENHTLSVDNFLDLDKLMEENSPYLVDGSLEGTVFLKIQDVGHHLVDKASDKK